MPEQRDDDLARELRELGRWLVTPEPPDVRAAVRERLTGRSPRVVSPRWLAAAAALLLAFVIALVPPARTAVADAATAVLRFAGVELDRGRVSGPLPATPSPLPTTRTATLDEARRLARFPITVPARLGAPESVQVADPDPTGAPRVVTLLYRNGAIRLDQFDGQLEPHFAKLIAATGARWTEVGREPAVWVPSPHPITYIDRTGTPREETARLAGSTLIWRTATGAYRLEGSLTFSEALAIANSAG